MDFFRRFAARFENWIDPLSGETTRKPPQGIWAFIWHFVGQAKLPFLALLILNGINGGLEALFFFFVGRLVDILDGAVASGGWPELLSQHGNELVLMLTIVVAVRFGVTLILGLVDDQVIGRGFYNLIAWQSYAYVARQSLGFFTSRHSGSVLTKVGQAGTALGDFVTGLLSTMWTIGIFLVTTLVLFFQLDLRLAAIVIIWMIFVAVLARYFLPRLRQQATQVAETRAVMNGRIVDIYANIQTIKLFATEGESDAYMRDGFARHLDAALQMGRLSISLRSLMTLISGIAFAAIALLCIDLWISGVITVGAVAFALALVLRLNMWLGRMLGSINGLMRNFGVLQNAMETVSQPLELSDAPDARDFVPGKGAISFHHVDFAYQPSSELVQDFTLDIAPGEKIGLVGHSGAGKTTIVNLLLRFYDLQSGHILVDGQDISELKQDSLRAGIGVVTQDATLLHRSVRENIRYGRPEATEAEIEAAAKRAEAHDFIVGLRDSDGRKGYDAQVGERGVKLSGGQRQRIAIARVILKNAPILVLDEATSALDSETEAAIQTQLQDLMKGRTVLAIAHRLSTIAAMDRLVFIADGRIIEKGTHAELLAANGAYAALWARQSGGFLPVDEQEPA